MSDQNKRLSEKARAAFERLPTYLQNDVVNFLEANPRTSLSDEWGVVDAWLGWNGIIGYTGMVIKLVRHAYGDVRKN
jgi:hypothetical protein